MNSMPGRMADKGRGGESAAERKAPAGPEPPALLVAGEGGGYSQELMEFAVAFAKRCGYSVHALSCLEPCEHAGPEAGTCLDESCGCHHQEEVAVRRAKGLGSLCAKDGIAFSHRILYGMLEDCVRRAYRDIPGAELVAGEPAGPGPPNRPPLVPVYVPVE